jgi:hypothetical protein
MADISAVKKRLAEGARKKEDPSPAGAEESKKDDNDDGEEDEEESKKDEEESKKDGESVNLLEEEEPKATAFLEESSSSSSSLSSFRFKRRGRKHTKDNTCLVNHSEAQQEQPAPVPEAVVVDSGSPLFVPVKVTLTGTTSEPSPSLAREWRLRRKKRRLEIRNALVADRSNNLPPTDEVEVDWKEDSVKPTQLTIPEDLQSNHSGSVVYRGDTQE